ncbi:MAG: ABC transporter ATP-binding protein [Verrucomicrobiota bacterium]
MPSLPSTSTSSFAIEATGLRKAYGDFLALRGIDLKVRHGSVFGFLGPNGAGKTTAIRCMLDLIRPCDGDVRVMGINPRLEPVAVRARCGYLPGELRLDENMSVRATLDFFKAIRGGDRVMETRANELAERLQLNLKAKVKTLSKGNKQKVGIIAAFLHQPDLFLLDEPTSGLDPLVQQAVLELVREAREAGATVFFSSHVLAEVQQIADEVAIIREGEIVESGLTELLAGGGIMRVKVTFPQPTAPAIEEFAMIPGVSVMETGNGGQLARLSVEGSMNPLLAVLAKHDIASMESRPPNLEEVFLAYYADNKNGKGSR